MATFSFRRGASVYLDHQKYTLDRQVGPDEWQLVHDITGRAVQHTTGALESLYLAAKLTGPIDGPAAPVLNRINPDFNLLSEAQQAEIRRKYAYVSAVVGAGITKYSPRTLPDVITQVHQEIGGQKPNWSTVRRWIVRYLDAGEDLRGLLDRHILKGNREGRYSAKVQSIVDQAIDEYYLQRERPSVQNTLQHAIALISQENALLPEIRQHKLPTRAYVQRRIDRIPAYDRVVARHGVETARRQFRTVNHTVIADHPLERVEIDHTCVDIMLVTDDYLPIGRPTLTLCLDVATRCVLGAYIGFESPSFATVAACLRQAILPKSDLLKPFGDIENEWEAHGIPQMLVVDNGREFHSTSLKHACYAFGIHIDYTPRKTPWAKPYIERLFGTFNKQVAHTLPGTTFSNITERGDYNPAKTSLMTLPVFKRILYRWIVDDYHQTTHRGLQDTPANAWRKGASRIPIKLPNSVSDFDYMLGHLAGDRVLTHAGITFEHLTYNSSELQQLRLNRGANITVTVKYEASDLGHIFVVDPRTQQPIRVPAINKDYATGLSHHLHKLCRKRAKDAGAGTDLSALARVKQDIANEVKDAMSHRRRAGWKRPNRDEATAPRHPASAHADSPMSTPVQEGAPVPQRLRTKPEERELVVHSGEDDDKR